MLASCIDQIAGNGNSMPKGVHQVWEVDRGSIHADYVGSWSTGGNRITVTYVFLGRLLWHLIKDGLQWYKQKGHLWG